MTYSYRSGYSVPGVTAAEAAEELRRIREEHGELTTDVVIDEARDDGAVLHPAFEWDDATAAENFRKQQARHLLRGICIVREDRETVPMHFHISTDDGGKYESVERVEADPDLYEAALSELTSKVRGAQAAVDQLIEIGRSRLRGKRRKIVEAVRQHLGEASKELAAVG